MDKSIFYSLLYFSCFVSVKCFNSVCNKIYGNWVEFKIKINFTKITIRGNEETLKITFLTK